VDLPRLLDNASHGPQALGQGALAHNSTSPNSQEGILFLTGMKEKNRVAFRGGGTTLLRLAQSG